MVSVTIDLDISSAVSKLTNIEERQIPFALARATNLTATDFQDAMRAGIAQRFILRRANFILNTVKIQRGDFATSKGFKQGGGKFEATVSIGGDVGTKRAGSGILVKFEEGGEKRSSDPNTPLIMPTRALQPSPAELPPLNMYPKHLGLVERRGVTKPIPAHIHVTRRGVPQIQGTRRTFVLDPSIDHGANVWGVYQRFGPKRSDIRLIWRYRMRIQIPRRLQFNETAQRVVPDRFRQNFQKTLAEALATAFS